MVLLVGQALYLFAPLLMSAVLAAVVQRYDWLVWLRRPIDGGRTFRGKRWFGDSKTWRGVVLAIIGCAFTVMLQRYVIGARAGALAVIDYRAVEPFVFGMAMGAGAMLGELPNSFIKRRLGVAPGKTTRGVWAAVFYIWDQVDMLMTAWPFIALWVTPTWRLVLASFGVALVLHPLMSLAGYLLGARKSAR